VLSKWSMWPIMMMFVVGISVLVMMLSGCGGGSGIGAGAGSVTGIVSILQGNIPVGLGNVTISIGGRSAVSGPDGRFTVVGIPAGGPYIVTITPPDGAALPPGAPTITVGVTSGQTSTIPEIGLIDSGDLPPDPPSA